MIRALLLALAGAVRCAAIQTGIEKAELRCGSGAERVVVDLLEPWKDKPLVPNLPDTHPDLGSSWSRRASSRKAVTTTVDYQLAAPLFVESPTMELRARHSVWRASDYCPGAIQSDGRGTGCGTFVRWDEETGRRGGGAAQPEQVDLNAVDGGGVLVEHRVPRPVVVPQLADCSIRIKPTATARLANWEFALTNIDATQLGSTSASMWSIWELGHAGLLLDASAKNGVMAQIIVIEPPEAETCPATLKGKAVLKFQLLEAVDLDAQLSGPRATEFTTSSVAVRSGSGRTGTYEVLGGEKVPLVHWDRRPQTVSVSQTAGTLAQVVPRRHGRGGVWVVGELCDQAGLRDQVAARRRGREPGGGPRLCADVDRPCERGRQPREACLRTLRCRTTAGRPSDRAQRL